MTGLDEILTLGRGSGSYRTRVVQDGDGPVVVLVHGTPLDVRAWGPIASLLTPRLRVVRYDARGHGAAAATPVPSTYGPLGDDLAALLDHLAVDRAHVVGHSWGGQVVQRFALDHPDRLHRLTLVCTRSAPFPPFHAAAAALRAGTADPEAPLRRWLSPETLARPAGIAGTVRAWLRAASVTSWADAMDLIAAFDVHADLPHIRVPVDFVAAEHDTVATPPHMAAAAGTLPDARLVVLPNAWHLVPLEQPEAVARVIHAGHPD